MRKLKPIPKNSSETLQLSLETPYLNSKGDSDTIHTKNRGNDISVKNDKIKDFSIGLQDIDNAVLYYFENTIKPNVIHNNVRIEVPVIYGSPEKWKSVQKDGFYRDKNGKLMVPLILFKRTNVEKNRSLGNKLDGNKPHLYQAFKEKFNIKNSYDKFSVINNIIPSEKFYLSVIPDYVKITYECIIFTDYVEQNNKLIEAIGYASDSYWGDFDRFNFRVNIDNFVTATTVEQDQDRAIKTTLTLTLQGYMISDTINKQSVDKNRYFSKSQILFGLEVVSEDPENITSFVGQSKLGGNNNLTSFVGGGNNITNNSSNNINNNDLIYLNTNITKTATSTSGSVAIFNGVSILEPTNPTSLPSTSISNFTFFANGNYIPQEAIISFSGSINPILTIDPLILGYNLEYLSVTAIGKFQ